MHLTVIHNRGVPVCPSKQQINSGKNYLIRLPRLPLHLRGKQQDDHRRIDRQLQRGLTESQGVHFGAISTVGRFPLLFIQTGSDRYRGQDDPAHDTWQRSGPCDERHGSEHDEGRAQECGWRHLHQGNEVRYQR